jgi:hypothetical protein
MSAIFIVDDMFLHVAVDVDELNVKCNRETVLLLRKLGVESEVCS